MESPHFVGKMGACSACTGRCCEAVQRAVQQNIASAAAANGSAAVGTSAAAAYAAPPAPAAQATQEMLSSEINQWIYLGKTRKKW